MLPTYELEIDNSHKLFGSVQAHIFHHKTGNFLSSIPAQFDPTLRQIYLVADTANPEKQILQFIPSLTPFFKKFGKFCFFCKKFFTSRGCNHKCSKTQCCFSCKRPFLKIDTFITNETKHLFCNGRYFSLTMQNCKTCNILYYSEECLKEHITKVCRWGWKCPKCNIYQGRNGFFKTTEEIKKNHICHKRRCNFCGEVKEAVHFCTLKEYKPKNEFTNIGFLSFAYSGFNVAKCSTCYIKNDGKACTNCPTNEERPIACIILQENNNRNSFSSKIIVDNEYEKKTQVKFLGKQACFLKYTYIPSFVQKNPALAPEGRQTRFGKRGTETKCKLVFKKEQMSLMDKLFDFLLHNNFSNSTIFVHSAVSKDMFFILQELLDNGFKPNVIKNHNKIMMIDDKKLSLRFVEIQNYVHGSFREICERIHHPIPYFPHQWIQLKYFDYSGPPPTINDFFDFEDNDQDLKEKEAEVLKSKSKPIWHFQEEFFRFFQLKVKIIAIVFLEFLKEAFCCQNILNQHFQTGSHSWKFLHPANPPIFTAATYSFQLFLLMSKAGNLLKTINNPIHFRSSKGEIEYIMYLMWKHPELKFNMAWSPYGQTNLKYTIPDAVCNNQYWYYNGCFYHGHKKEECKFNSKAKTELREKKEQDFLKKVQKLKSNVQVDQLTVMWECCWRDLKKKDANVKYFLRNIYTNPPLSRLNAREAGMCYIHVCVHVCVGVGVYVLFSVRGGLNEVYRIFWDKKEAQNGIMYYLDKNSAYLFMAMQNSFPIGPYDILTYYDLQNLRFNGTYFETQNGTKLLGLALVRVLCPPNIKFPFLSYRSTTTGRNYIACCKLCADTKSLNCTHSIE